MRRIVDLPQPDGPRSATNAPAGAARSTPSRATTGLRPTLNSLHKERSDMPVPESATGVAVSFVSRSVTVAVACLSGRGDLEVGELLVELVDQREIEQLLLGD